MYSVSFPVVNIFHINLVRIVIHIYTADMNLRLRQILIERNLAFKFLIKQKLSCEYP